MVFEKVTSLFDFNDIVKQTSFLWFEFSLSKTGNANGECQLLTLERFLTGVDEVCSKAGYCKRRAKASNKCVNGDSFGPKEPPNEGMSSVNEYYNLIAICLKRFSLQYIHVYRVVLFD